jgi:uncharacterized protein YdaU (DUF1376 family)
MNKPWMPLFIGAYLKNTSHLRALESGAYLHLIMAYWVGGKLPEDDRQLATIAKVTDKEWRQIKPTIQAFFYDGWRHERIDEELASAAAIAEANSKKATDAANKRWSSKHAPSDAPSMPQASSEHPPSNAPECTLHTSQSKKEDAPSGAPKWAFESGRIRLNAKNLAQWKSAYEHLSLEAELLGLSKWAEEQGDNWFCAVSGALAKRNREIGMRQKQQERPEAIRCTTGQ